MRASWKGACCVNADHNARAYRDPWKQTDYWNVRYKTRAREIHREWKFQRVRQRGSTARYNTVFHPRHSTFLHSFLMCHISLLHWNMTSTLKCGRLSSGILCACVCACVCMCVCVCLGNRNRSRGLWIAIPFECVFMSMRLQICMCITNERLRQRA